MRANLTTFILIISLMQVSAASFGQKLTLKQNNVPITKVLLEIRKQMGYDVLVESTNFKSDRRINANFSEAPLTVVMDEITRNFDLVYTIEKKTVVIKEKEPSFLDNLIGRIAAVDVRGRVVSAETGEPLAGATVKVKGTSKSVSTDVNGNFFLRDVDEKAMIVISYVGYKQVELSAAKDMWVKLEVTSGDLQEVIINKGYYTQKQELNTGSVAIVGSKELGRQPVGDPLASLQGRIPGLQIQQVTGLPGGEFTVRLRGQNSIANGKDPLYIIDGVPFSSTPMSMSSPTAIVRQSPFNTLNIADIESISVLKDADATAIYGSMGANGVVLITSKKGESGPFQMNFNFYSGAGEVTRKLDLMNTQEYLEMRMEALRNDNRTPTAFESDVTVWDKTKYTDWQEVFIGGTAKVNDYQVRFSGGSPLSQYHMGGGYRKETTVYPGNYFDAKGSFQGGFNHRSQDNKFLATFSSSMNVGNNSMPETNFINYITMAPNTPDLLLPDGTMNTDGFNFLISNPYGQRYITSRSKTKNLIANATLSYEIIPRLKISSSFGYNQREMLQNILTPSISYLPPDNQSPLGRINNFMTNKVDSWIIEPQLSYQYRNGGNQFDFVAGTTLRQNVQDMLTQTATGFASDALIENIKAASSLSATAYRNTNYKYQAIFGRIGYNYKEKYVVNLTGRRDGSSRFGPNKKFGNFGAVGVAWIFSKEKFLRNRDGILSLGKIRASYGVTGNDQLTDYQFLRTYEPLGYVYSGVPGLLPTRLSNPTFSWEEVKKFELGLELGMFNNRIQTTLNYYRNRTGNQLVGYPLSWVTGFNTIQANMPARIQNTGVEIELTSTVLRSEKFQWNVSANFTFPNSKLLAFPNLEAHPTYATQYKVGYPLNTSYRFISTGIDSQTGLYSFKDLNGDGTITYANDMEFYMPKKSYFGGVSSDLRFKDFGFSFLLQIVKQERAKFEYLANPGLFNTNQPKTMVNRWRQPGDENLLRYSSQSMDQHAMYLSSNGVLTDGSFIRLKNISLSWNIKREWAKSIHVKDLKFFVQGQNLFVITNYQGLDPEFGGSSLTLPPLRMISAGLNITL